MSDPVLVTGAAGFIGMHVARRLLAQGRDVLGIDDLNPYYDPRLKSLRIAELASHVRFRFERVDLADRQAMADLFAAHRFGEVIHLGAQAGVRHSLIDPHAYGSANLTGFLNVLEGCRRNGCRHLVYASSSSVYGANTRIPFQVSDSVGHPLNLYAASKRANELMAHAYAHLFALPATGLRFFTVYGPWGRPDMAMWLFTEAIMQGRPIKLFNHGNMRRDFTYVDDAVEAVIRLLERPPAGNKSWSGQHPDPGSSRAPWRVFNIGNSSPIALLELVGLLEQSIGRAAVKELLPLQPGDALETCADVSELEALIGYRPVTPIATGVGNFVVWFREFMGKEPALQSVQAEP